MKLTKELFFEAIKKSFKNAGELIGDANILKENYRWARAYTLFQLAIEEMGKSLWIISFLLLEDYENEENQKNFLKDIKSHKPKISKSIGLDFIILSAIKNTKIKKAILQNMGNQYDHIDSINNLKNLSLYTSEIKGNFFTPSEIITEKQVKDIEFYANTRYLTIDSFIQVVIIDFEKIKKGIALMDLEKSEKELDKELLNILQ